MKIIYNQNNKLVLRLEKGEDFFEAVKSVAARLGIKGAFFYGLGGFLSAEIAYYDLSRKEYLKKSFAGPLEVASIIGNLSQFSEELMIHVHVALGLNDYRSVAGHLTQATVGATTELFFDLVPGLNRELDDEIGLKLLAAD